MGDAVRISNAATKASDMFKVVAIERDVDKFGTPLPTLGHQRTIRVHATKEPAQHTVVHRHFFATERSAHGGSPRPTSPTSATGPTQMQPWLEE